MKLQRCIRSTFRTGLLFAGLVASATIASATTPVVTTAPLVAADLFANGTQLITATVAHDTGTDGVSWSIVGSGVGTLSGASTTQVTYTAPSSISALTTVQIKATSIAKNTVSAITTIVLNPSGVYKAPLSGLVAMGDVSYTNHDTVPNNTPSELTAFPGIFSGIVINVLWSQLEPTEGVFDFSSIDGTLSSVTGVDYTGQGLAAVTSYNSAHSSHPVRVKIRVHPDTGGQTNPDGSPFNGTPNFVLALGGVTGGVAIGAETSGTTQVGAYYTSTYHSKMAALQSALAAAYDSNALVATISMESCASRDAEVMHEATDWTSITNLRSLSPAYNDAQGSACYESAASDYSAWAYTNIDYPLGQGFHGTDSCMSSSDTPTCVTLDQTVTTGIIASMRIQYGARSGVGNENFAATPPGTESQIYAQYAAAPGAFQFQGPNSATFAQNCPILLEAMSLLPVGTPLSMEIHQSQHVPSNGYGGADPMDSAQMTQLETYITSFEAGTVPTSCVDPG